MYERIIVPLDGSALSRQAIPYGKLIAEGVGASLELVQAIPSLSEIMQGVAAAGRDRSHVSYDEWQRQFARVRETSAKQLRQTAEGLRVSGKEVSARILEGRPASAIAHDACKVPGTMIVMTTHGRSGLNRFWLGSVTDEVVQHAGCPTLVIRARAEGVQTPGKLFDGIVLPLDGSELAELAVPHAAELAKSLGMELTLLRAVSPVITGELDAPTMSDLMDQISEEAKEYIHESAEHLRKEGVTRVEEMVLGGQPAYALLDALEKKGEPLVVMATHGRSGVSRLLLGSVTDRMVRHAPGPVLVVPGRSGRE